MHVENGAAIYARRDAETDARREVRLDDTGDDVDTRALRREHQMHADRARHLRQTRNRFFDVAAFEHHEIRQFVDQDQHVRQRLHLFRVGSSSSKRLRGSACSLRIFLLY